MHTLVVHTGGIGDFLLTCPALKCLAREGPLELLGCKDRLALAVEAGIAVAAHGLDAVDFTSAYGAPSDRLRAFLSRFDRCIVWQRDDGTLERSLRACGVTDVRAYPGLPPKDWAAHASRHYLDCLGITQPPTPGLAIKPGGTRRDVVIHPGSGGRFKNWPLEHFAAVAEALETRGRNVTWCAGPAEEDVVLPGHRPILRVGSLVSLARELAAASLYIGNDSGITHLAAAAGCRTLAVFGPTNPAIWAPQGNRAVAVSGDPWPTVTEVLGELAVFSDSPD